MNNTIGKLLAVTAGLVLSTAAHAYPDKPVTMIVAWGAGGATDVVARAIQPYWSKKLGAEIVIKNVAGAAGTIGTTEAATAKPDGYTIMVTPAGPMTTQPHLRKLRYSIDSFAPIGRISISPQVMMVPKTAPYQTAEALFDAIKKEPGKLVAASTGAGTLPHIGIIAMNQSGLDVKHLPFTSSVDAMRGLLGGTAQVFSDQVQLVPSFDVTPLATWTGERLPEYPNVPTMKELGFDYEISNWGGAFAPKGTPAPVLEKLASSLKEAMEDPELLAALDKLKVQRGYMDSEEFGTFASNDSARNRKLLEAANLLAK